MLSSLVSVAAFLGLLPLSCSAQAISANSKTFKEIVLDSPHVVMVEFFAPWCGHCKNLEPEYQKAAAKLKGVAKLVQVDCDNSSNKELCGRFEVQGFPTLKVFSAGTKGIPTPYNGERTAKAIVDAITPMIPGKYVNKILAAPGSNKKALTLEAFKDKSPKGVSKVILITEKKTTPTLFKGLSIEYLNRLAFGEIKKATGEVELIASLNVTSFPSVLIFPEGSTSAILYDGKMKLAPLSAFLDKYAIPLPVKEKKSPKKKAASDNSEKPAKKEKKEKKGKKAAKEKKEAKDSTKKKDAADNNDEL